MNNVKKILSCFSCQKWGCDLYTHATYSRINTVICKKINNFDNNNLIVKSSDSLNLLVLENFTVP